LAIIDLLATEAAVQQLLVISVAASATINTYVSPNDTCAHIEVAYCQPCDRNI